MVQQTSRLRDQYDWIVVGDSPGALLSASLVARQGLSVLVLQSAPGAKPWVSKSGQYFDPETNYILGLGRLERANGLVSECVGRLGALPSEVERVRRETSGPEILTPRTRTAFATDDQEFERNLSREFGPEAVESLALMPAISAGESATLQFWRRVPERLTLSQGKAVGGDEPRSWPEVLKRIRREAGLATGSERRWLDGRKRMSEADWKGDPDLHSFLRGAWYALAGSDASSPRWSDLFRAMALGRTGASFRGGIAAFRDFLCRLAERQGAHVPRRAECRRIFVDRSKFMGVQVANRGSVIAGRGAILGCALDHTREFMTWSRGVWAPRLKRSPRPQGWKYSVSLTVATEAIPLGMPSRAVWTEASAPLLEIEVARPGDFGIIAHDRRIVFLRTVLPFRQETLDPGFLRMQSARMVRQLMEIFPFLEFHVGRIYPDFREGDREISEAFGYASINQIPENLRCVDGSGIGSRAGVEGLFVATGESFPELGSLGQFVASIEATAWICHRSGLGGPLP